MIIYTIAKIAFLTVRLIASLYFISAVQYMIRFKYNFLQYPLQSYLYNLDIDHHVHNEVNFHLILWSNLNLRVNSCTELVITIITVSYTHLRAHETDS